MSDKSIDILRSKLVALDGAGVMAQAAAAGEVAVLVLQILEEHERRLRVLEKGGSDETSG